MAKRTNARHRPAVGRHVSTRKPSAAWRSWAIGAAAVAALGVVVVLAIQAAGRESTEDPTITALARENAGGEVRVLTGTHHTVYHSVAPLPSDGVPRADGKPTLVWFSGTWCEFCERMEPFAHQAASDFADRLVFVEKSVDDDRSAAARYGVRGTPTFVLIDASGQEIARFGFQPTLPAFAQAIETALARTVAT
ncbi:MAG: thioredoxin family protein [Dehalococcoidia bacterium]